MSSNPRPALLLLPNLLGEGVHPDLYLPASVARAVATLDGLIAESTTGGRRFLGHFLTPEQVRHLPIAVVDGQTASADIDFYLEPIAKGQRWGYVSDGGLPCLADPGASLVRRARQRGLAVQAFSGPSSLFMGLMLSGLPAQRFAFTGYLSKKQEERHKELVQLEKRSKSEDSTQIAIEAPHRSDQLLTEAIAALNPATLLCVAWDLTLPGQGTVCQTVATWRKSVLPQLRGKPAIFYIYAGKLD
jgi:16S rRNA (cytidine1402-2'-O)-methyltransferase